MLTLSYWFTEDTKQVRDVAVSVSLSADTAADQAVVRSRIRRLVDPSWIPVAGRTASRACSSGG